MSTMAVTADHFSLYEAFKKEAEKLGWTYHSDFVPFDVIRTNLCNCFYFSFDFGNMEGRPAFSLSSTSEKTFQLETQFQEALDMAKHIIDNYHVKTIELNDLYTAEINVKDKTVTVYEEHLGKEFYGKQYGEQFSFDKIREITEIIDSLELEYFLQKTRKTC